MLMMHASRHRGALIKTSLAVLALGTGVLALSACKQAAPEAEEATPAAEASTAATPEGGSAANEAVSVAGAWVRLPAAEGRPGAAYFTLSATKAAAELTGVSSPLAGRTELHETVTENGVAQMRPVKSVKVEPGQTSEFKPGGQHVMLFDLKPEAKDAKVVPLTLTFADGSTIDVEATTKMADAAAGAGMEHEGH